MPKSYYGYDSYRGRSGGKIALTALIVVLLLVLLLAVAFFFFAQPYISYDGDGKAHLNLPFLRREENTPPPMPSEELVLVVETPEPTPTPEPVPEPGMTIVELPLEALLDGTARDRVEAVGGNAALFVMKGEDGKLGYVSKLDMAANSGVNPKGARPNEAIAEANQGDLYTIAKVNCFKDNAVPYQYGRWAGFRIPEGNWRGSDGSRWLSPATQRARDYIVSICKELCTLGFDEIWLNWCAFPADGALERIIRGTAYNDDTLTEDLEAFYAQISEALAQYPEVTLAFTAQRGALLEDPDDKSGQTAELLAKYAQKLYLPLPQEGEDYTAVLEKIGLEDGQLVYLTDGVSSTGAGRIVTP